MAATHNKCDVLIVGAGVVGLCIGIALLEAKSYLKVVIVEKEINIGRHASGRNSGVLHAGFYYSPESLKAKFCRDGNIQLKQIAKKYGVPVREVGKVVVVRNVEEDSQLDLLYERGIANGVDLEILDGSLLRKIEPLAATFSRFIWSPSTAVSDPISIINALRSEFISMGGEIHYGIKLKLSESLNEVYDVSRQYQARLIVNAAGASADRISRALNIGSEYAMLPFMGIYRSTNERNLPLKRLVYPVPHKVNPFLGVHFTLTVDGMVKIGPTAIPLLGREQYSIFQGWSASDTIQALKAARSLVYSNAHNFSSIVKTEWPKLILRNLVNDSISLVPRASDVLKWTKKEPGIRSQLVHLPTGRLEQDFVVKQHLNTIHVLNAVSPGWTSAIPFGKWIVSEFLANA